jgi:hypothetical protein
MPIGLNSPGSGVAAFLLSFNTLIALEKNGTLADYELTEVVEQSLTKLKALDALPSVQSQDAHHVALEFLEQLNERLARERSRRQLDYLNY